MIINLAISGLKLKLSKVGRYDLVFPLSVVLELMRLVLEMMELANLVAKYDAVCISGGFCT